MNLREHKPDENKSQSAAKAISQKQNNKRPESVAQRKFQAIADNSLQVKQAVRLQSMANNATAPIQKQTLEEEHGLIQKKANNTGLPDNLKSGIENLSGYSMDDVKVHYNSDKPAQLQALAYAQGTEIHLGSGQEKHLPHEAWHVVQQKQGRVQPTMQMKGNVNVNDDAGLEEEADVMNHGVGADAGTEQEPKPIKKAPAPSDALSMLKNKTLSPTIETRCVAFLCADGVDAASVNELKSALEKGGASAKIIGINATSVKTADGKELKVDHSLHTVASVLFDAVYIPAGEGSINELKKQDKIPEFLMDMYKHCKVIGLSEDALPLLDDTTIKKKVKETDFEAFGIITGNKSAAFTKALSKHRFWNREATVIL